MACPCGAGARRPPLPVSCQCWAPPVTVLRRAVVSSTPFQSNTLLPGRSPPSTPAGALLLRPGSRPAPRLPRASADAPERKRGAAEKKRATFRTLGRGRNVFFFCSVAGIPTVRCVDAPLPPGRNPAGGSREQPCALPYAARQAAQVVPGHVVCAARAGWRMGADG